MRIHLTYFRQSGKYYCEGDYESDKKHAFEVFDEIKAMQRESRLPGIIGGPTWLVLVMSHDTPEEDAANLHPHLFPALEPEQ